VNVIICTLGRNVSAVQVSLSQQKLEYPTIVSPVQMQILTALNMGLVSVEYVNVLRASMASTVNVMILHVNWQMVNCALVMAPVSVGNVSVMQTGLVRPANVRFLWTAVDPTK
jgi:hypothetical protein